MLKVKERRLRMESHPGTDILLVALQLRQVLALHLAFRAASEHIPVRTGPFILEAITITKDISNNGNYANALSRIHDHVRDGQTLAAPMEREKVFPKMVTSMIDVGEETGALAEMLNRVADNYDEDVDNAVGGITSIIEPVMIVFLAVVVGFIVIALFLPIIEIIKQLS